MSDGVKPVHVVVVGGGIGGLSSAIALAARGCRVTLLERAARVGGKMSAVRVGDRSVDSGPTVLTMRWVFDELFASAGTTLEEHVTLVPSEVLARHAWTDGTRLDLFADPERSRRAVVETFGREAGAAFVRFREDSRRIYETVLEPFLRSQRPDVTSMLKWTAGHGLGAFTRIDAFRTMWAALTQAFREPKLRQLFGRYATYCGSSPFEAPATLNLVAHVESEGVFRVAGGMDALARSLENLASSLGVVIHVGHEVERIVVENGAATGVVVNGDTIGADAVVFNGDVDALGRALLGERAKGAADPTPVSKRSLSAITWALVGRASDFPLVHHNVFFSDDYEAELETLMARRRVPETPTVYLCAQDRADVTADLDDERMLLVVNAPPTGDEPARWSEAERSRCTETTFETLRRCGLRLEPRATTQSTPVELAARFPSTGGALYGPIAHGPFSALARHGARTKVRSLYLAGGSVHPGPGVPMCALSGRLAAEQLSNDLASTTLSRRRAIRGITSTP